MGTLVHISFMMQACLRINIQSVLLMQIKEAMG